MARMGMSVLLGALVAACLWQASQAADAASSGDAGAPVYRAVYPSALFGGDVTVQVSPSTVSLIAAAPTTLVSAVDNGAFITNMPMNETFPLPANASQYTVVDHITVFYNPTGAFPYASGKANPLWVGNISRSLSCVTCWFYVVFHFLPQNQTQNVGSACAPSPSGFCTAELVLAGTTPIPDADFLPKSFAPAAGDMYPESVVQSSITGSKLSSLRSLAQPVTPLIALQMGQFWVSKQPIYTFQYNGTKILGAQNFYLSDAGQVIGVGQVVSRDYFTFFSNFFAHTDPVKGQLVNASGPFDVPSNFSVAGDYPGGVVTEINGFKGTSTFSFGFTNTSYRMAPPPNAGSSLVLNLPWLIASVWIAGAVVLLSDHL